MEQFGGPVVARSHQWHCRLSLDRLSRLLLLSRSSTERVKTWLASFDLEMKAVCCRQIPQVAKPKRVLGDSTCQA